MTALAQTRYDLTRPTLHEPAGWHCSRSSDGSEGWTWCHDGLPLVSVRVGRDATMSPPAISDPYSYRMQPVLVRRCAEALDALAVYVAARGPR